VYNESTIKSRQLLFLEINRATELPLCALFTNVEKLGKDNSVDAIYLSRLMIASYLENVY